MVVVEPGPGTVVVNVVVLTPPSKVIVGPGMLTVTVERPGPGRVTVTVGPGFVPPGPTGVREGHVPGKTLVIVV